MTDPGAPAGPDPAVEAPAPDPPPGGPSAAATWARRGVIALLLVLAAAILVWGTRDTTSGLDDDAGDPVVVTRVPLPGAIEPRQVDIGAELALGYDGRLVINGIEIPEEEMVGAIDPASVSAAELRRFGVRPNARHRVFFRPGPGKVIESLPRGEVQITVDYFRDRNPGEGRGSTSWTITVN